MTPGTNFNHPTPGSTIKVAPITNLKDIQRIKNDLKEQPRNLALFTLGINTNLRASDLIRITAGQVRNLQPMGELSIREKKTGKIRRINLNKSCIDTVQNYLAAVNLKDDDVLFNLTVPSVNRLVKHWCEWADLKGNFGAHTLRKTFAYHQYFTFRVPLAILTVMFNHHSEAQTLDYICVQPTQVIDAYANEI